MLLCAMREEKRGRGRETRAEKTHVARARSDEKKRGREVERCAKDADTGRGDASRGSRRTPIGASRL